MILADDVAVMTASATRKTAGIIGDDIAVNAKQVIGVRQDRENHVVKELVKGSLKNKALLIPAFFGMSLVAGGALIPLCLLAGASYLCYEAAEKVLHSLSHSHKHEEHKSEILEAAHNDPEKSERQKIKAAITTDFVLSAEIIAIGLGSVTAFASGLSAGMGPAAVLAAQFAALTGVGILSTGLVYGPLWGFLKIDNLGIALTNSENNLVQNIGHFLVEKAVPILSKTLSVAGTAAMFVVGGELFMHHLAPMYHPLETLVHSAEAFFHTIPMGESIILPMISGVASGTVLLPVIEFGVKPVYTHVIDPLLVSPVSNLLKKAKGLFVRNEPEAEPAPAADNEQEQQQPLILTGIHRLDTDTPAVEEPQVSPRDALTKANRQPEASQQPANDATPEEDIKANQTPHP